jgi:hypothetical protein
VPGVLRHLVARVAEGLLTLRKLKVVVHHHRRELLDRRRRDPAELLLGFRRVAQEQVDLGRPQVPLVERNVVLVIKAL